MQHAAKLQPGIGEQHLDAEHLDAAGGRAGAAADEGQQEQHGEREPGPAAPIQGGKAGAGHHAGDREQGMAQGRQRLGVLLDDQPQGDGQRRQHDRRQIALQLAIVPDLLPLPPHDLPMHDERRAAQQHPDENDPIDAGIVPGADRVVVRREAAAGNGAHRMKQRRERRHSGNHQQQRQNRGQPGIDRENSPQHAQRPGRHAVVEPGRLQPVKLHAADIELRQHRHGERQHADAAHPLQQGAP